MTSPADNTGRCKVCGLAPQVRGCTPGDCRTRPKGAAMVEMYARPPSGAPAGASADKPPAHPQPWRWSDDDLTFVDAANQRLIEAANDEDSGGSWLVVESPYLRAVFARAGAMEALLRQIDVEELTRGTDVGQELAALLAELDAAKAQP